MSQPTFIDLFSGCGGMSLGFEMAGYRSLLAIDCWQDALTTYADNRPGVKTLCADIEQIDIQALQTELGEARPDVIIGGPPCQGFSVAGKRMVDDKRNVLYKSFVRFVDAFSPKAFVMENVPNILSMGEGIVRDSILRDFQELGYKVTYQVLLAADYGVPQNRRRAFFVGIRNGETFVFPEKTVVEATTSKEALSDLPETSLEDGASYPCVAQSDFQRLMRKNSLGIYNHQTTAHNEQTVRIISLVPDGGNYKSLPESLQGTRKVHIAWTRLNSQRPSFTIDTGHRHHFHYLWNRVPTVRESARLQSFPDDFVFLGSRTSQNKQVGNAVPPLLALPLALSLQKHLL